MRCFFRWVAFSIVASSSAVALAQQTSPIIPNYGRSAQRVAQHEALPSVGQSVAVGSGVEEMTIPQQGHVDMGSTSAPYSTSSSYGHNDHAAAPSYSSGSSYGSYSVAPSAHSSGYSSIGPQYGDSCSSCGSNSCNGGCAVGHANVLPRVGGGGGWFGGVYYMNLWRDDDNFGYPLATATANPGVPVLQTSGARMEDASGFGVRLGKMLNQNSAVEFIYWQVFPGDETAIAQNSVVGSTINSTLLFNDLTYDSTVGAGAVPVQDFFTDSQYMSVTRTFDYRNFELNFLRLPYVFGGCNTGKARLALLAGVRYFKADESLTLFSDDLNEIPGDDPNHELTYLNEVENDLVGFQVGGVLNYQVTSRLSGQFGSKAGIYNNRMKQTQAFSGGAGGALIGGAGPDAGQPFALVSKKNDVAFLGEFDAGVAYCVNSNWRLTGGYKVLAISGYADSVNQIPYTYNSLATTGLIQDNNSLILHGLYFGVEHSW